MFSFINPIFLYAAAAAMIPLILHMMQRRRTIVLPFSTIRFLKLAQQRSSNRIRMENFLLWLLRTLLMLIIAMAFAMPVVRTTSFAQWMGSSRRDVAIVWDVSYSMDYISGRKKVWETAKETAVALIEELRKGDRVCIFLADDDITPLIEQPSTDLEMALSLVKAQDVRPTTSRLGPAVITAYNALKSPGRQERELFIITDGQALPWQAFGGMGSNIVSSATSTTATEAAASSPTNPPSSGTNPPEVKAQETAWNPDKLDSKIAPFVVLLGATAPENVAPVALDIQPNPLMTDIAGKLSARVSCFGPSQSISVSLIIDEQEVSRRSIVLDNNASDEVVFSLPPLQTGPHAGRIETPSDGLPMDNILYFLLQVKQKMPVLCVGTEQDAFYLMRALNPNPEKATIDVRRVDPDAMANENMNSFLCIFLCNAMPIPGPALQALEQYARRGGLVAIFPGDKGTPKDYESLICLPALPTVIQDVKEESQRRTLSLVKPGDRLFTGMMLPPGAVPVLSIKREFSFGKLESKSDVVISAGNENPFLLRRFFGSGQVLLFSVSADRKWSTFPLSPFFLPFMHQAVQFGAGLGNEKLFHWTTRNLVLNDVLRQIPETFDMLSPSDETIPVRKLKGEKEITCNVENLFKPGLYRMAIPGKPTHDPIMAINIVREESNLERVKPADLPELTGIKTLSIAESKDDLFRMIKERRIGRPLCENMLWLAFLLAIVELWLSNKLSRKTGTLSEKLTIESSGRVKGSATI